MIRIGCAVVVIICSVVIAVSNIMSPNDYPAWAYRTFFALAASGLLWGSLMLVRSIKSLALTKAQQTVLDTLRMVSCGIMIGICIVLGLAGYLGL